MTRWISGTTRRAEARAAAGRAASPDEAVRRGYRRVRATVQRLVREMPRWQRRVLAVLGLTMLVVVLTAAAAMADDGEASVPGALKFMAFEDSHGLSIFDYDLMVDRGGATEPGKVIFSVFCDLAWWVYLIGVAICAWVVDFALAFEWLDVLTGPAQVAEDGLQSIVSQIGLPSLLVALMALITGCWMWFGKMSAGLFELILSLIIFGVTAGALAQPVELVAGEDGLLVKGRDFGLTLASGLQDDKKVDQDANPEELREDLVGIITETFVRRPHMVINAGKIIDEDCEDSWSGLVGSGTEDAEFTNFGGGGLPGDSDAIEEGEKCRGELGDAEDVAENPGVGMLFSIIAAWPTAALVSVFSISLALMLLVAVVYSLYEAVKMVVALVVAILPGGARGALWGSLSQWIVSWLSMVYSVGFLAVYWLGIREVFDTFGSTGSGPFNVFYFVDFLLLVGVIIYWKGRNRIQAMRERIAEAMRRRTRSSPGSRSLPVKSGSPLKVAQTVGTTALAHRLGAGGGGRGGGRNPERPLKAGPTTAGQGRQLPAGGSTGGGGAPPDAGEQPTSPGPGGGGPTPSPLATRMSEAETKRPSGSQLRKSTHVVAFAGAAAATGGTSAAAAGGAAAGSSASGQFVLRTARRQALDELLTNRSSGNGSSSGAGTLPRRHSTAPGGLQ